MSTRPRNCTDRRAGAFFFVDFFAVVAAAVDPMGGSTEAGASGVAADSGGMHATSSSLRFLTGFPLTDTTAIPTRRLEAPAAA
eukprot:CAMPEP_0182597026 /NCGR_PEP_ID=MMETSP1324-20130603/85436_1 /TAXON_ID=236786 /ORGANISM="Florenciella sp., Strain RCC1587" /LENGTH=82 /DNA_ID=CAMNT_0024814749 /DNA_START=28 /DNA_END=273 /DNA_ORIENTATION=+